MSMVTIRLLKLYILHVYNYYNTRTIRGETMKKLLTTIFIILLAATSSLNFAAAQNETEMIIANTEEEQVGRTGEKSLALENGNLNISFEDGYNGYCIDYGKHEAEIGDSFTIEDTSHAVNKNSGQSVGNYLKVYFVDYYDHTLKNEIVTQHTIWHFTDDFNGWRLDYDLIDSIKATASTKTIPDYGAVKKINNTTEAVFDFKVFKSEKFENQNFFGYKITYRNIIDEILKDNETEPNPDGSNNATEPEKTNDTSTNSSDEKVKPHKTPNNIRIQFESDEIADDCENEKVSLAKHATGNGMTIGIVMLLLLLCFVAIKFTRDY